MISNILQLPFRKTHAVELSTAIKQYISGKYDQHPDMFRQDLEVIDNLRRDAANVKEPHASGARRIAAYAAQLSWMGSKFPDDIGIEFSWYPALGYNTDRPVSQNSLIFERVNILYNLAALYSQLATSVNRSTGDGLKSAVRYFCLAAGVVSHLKDVIPTMINPPPEDMDIATLESIQQLLLAQAQECFWQKAVMDRYKDASIAKLAVRVSDLYITASDWAVKSEAISSEWIHHMTAKHHHFAAAAQYRQSCVCLDQRKYGEEVARLQDSLVCVNEAIKESRYVNKMVLEDINGLRSRVQEDLRRAEKDNDLIYLNPIPPKSELKVLERANMAVAKIPDEVAAPQDFLGEGCEFGRPLFAQLVPFAVHAAASVYEERRDRLLNSQIISQYENLTAQIHETLRSLNLPGSLQALEKPLGLPSSLLSHAEDVRQTDAIARLQRSFSDLEKLKQTNNTMFVEGRETLLTENNEDEKLRMKYGTQRWTRPGSILAGAKLHGQIREISGYLESSAKSDELVRNKYRQCDEMLRMLMSSDRELGNFVPSSRRVAVPPQLEAEVTRLRNCLNDLSRYETRRQRKIDAIREKAKKDDISSAILLEAGRLERLTPGTQLSTGSFENFFITRLAQYDTDIELLKTEEHEQNDMLNHVASCNAAFLAAKAGDTSSRAREQALQKLENAYFMYKEIVSNLETARKFYNDLSKIVGRFRDDAKSFSYGRRSEAAEIESGLNIPGVSSSMSNLNLQAQRHDNIVTRETRSVARQRENETPIPPPLTTRLSTVPVQAPAPVAAIWSPELGIKFGGSAAGHVEQTAQGGVWDPNNSLKFG